MENIVFIPIDNRPVCYSLAEQIADINENVKLLLPPRTMLGDLKKTADINGLLKWIETQKQVDKIVLSLDTIAHGGLISSRRSKDTFEEIENRINLLKSILKKKNVQVFAFSSIMRISNNNVNEEEKEYWNLYGKKIFKYSYEFHKNGSTDSNIPEDILKDYLKTRNRNFEINKLYLEWAKQGFFNTLVFSKDDCAQYGLNVKEAQELQELIDKNSLNALIKTGADEIPLSLLSRAVIGGKEIKIAPVFTEPDYIDKISKYEDVSVYDSVKGQIELAGAKIAPENTADIVLLINNFKEEQGELVMGVDVEGFKGQICFPEKPFIIADIRNANGADNELVKELLEFDLTCENFLGYGAWNTTGNTLGSVICCALFKYLSLKFNKKAFQKVQMIRFLDDWAYQANVRKEMKNESVGIDEKILKDKMKNFENLIKEKFSCNFTEISYKFPWNRLFEIEVLINVNKTM